MTLEEINRIESNGSTALHVASHQGHDEIVKLILQKGARCSIININGCTPLDEAKTDEIKQLISHRMNKTRFVSDPMEWIFLTDNADYQTHEYFKKLKSYVKDERLAELIIDMVQNYLEKQLQHVDDINTIKAHFDKARIENDPTPLLTAYTAETGFYTRLNIDLAKVKFELSSIEENLSLAYFIGIVALHPKFEALSYIGQVFRGLLMTSNDIKNYRVGSRILTKTFSSTSKRREIASTFHTVETVSNDCFSAMCVYQVRNPRTALDIENISLFPYEEEVLILPYSAFKIISIRQNENSSPQIEIKLKECEPWSDDDE